MDFEELSRIYNVVMLSNKRFYKENLNHRDYILENTRPEYFRIFGDEFNETSWGKLLKEVADYLIEEYEPSIVDLLNMRVDWTKQKVFMDVPNMSAHQLLENGLYINTNHTALHSCWLLQDLLKFFNVDIKNVELIIHKLPNVEPADVKDFFHKVNKDNFRYFVLSVEKKTMDYYRVVENGIIYINGFINKHFPSYENIYLFDDLLTYASVKSKILQKMRTINYTSEKNIETFNKIMILYNKYLNYINR